MRASPILNDRICYVDIYGPNVFNRFLVLGIGNFVVHDVFRFPLIL